jgi:hypothetical protein
VPTNLQALTELLHQTGALELIFQRAGATAGIAAILTLLCVVLGIRSSVLRAFAIVTILAVLTLLGAGAYGTYTAYKTTDAAVASVTPPSAAERQKRAGYSDGRVHLMLAVGFSAVPLFVGLFGLVVAGRRRWRDNPDSPEHLRRLVATVVFLDLMGIGAEAIVFKYPLPGRDLDETGWKVVEFGEAVDAQHFETCLTFDTAIDKTSRAHRLPQLRDNAKRCADHFLSPVPMASPTATADLKRLLAAAWFEDEGPRAKVQAKLDEQAKAEEQEAARKKTLADEEEAARTQVAEVAKGCLEQTAKKGHKQKHPSATLALTVASSGDVQSVDEGKGALEPAPLRKCVIDGVKKLKLANTSGADRKLDVPVVLR